MNNNSKSTIGYIPQNKFGLHLYENMSEPTYFDNKDLYSPQHYNYDKDGNYVSFNELDDNKGKEVAIPYNGK